MTYYANTFNNPVVSIDPTIEVNGFANDAEQNLFKIRLSPVTKLHTLVITGVPHEDGLFLFPSPSRVRDWLSAIYRMHETYGLYIDASKIETIFWDADVDLEGSTVKYLNKNTCNNFTVKVDFTDTRHAGRTHLRKHEIKFEDSKLVESEFVTQKTWNAITKMVNVRILRKFKPAMHEGYPAVTCRAENGVQIIATTRYPDEPIVQILEQVA